MLFLFNSNHQFMNCLKNWPGKYTRIYHSNTTFLTTKLQMVVSNFSHQTDCFKHWPVSNKSKTLDNVNTMYWHLMSIDIDQGQLVDLSEMSSGADQTVAGAADD